jgi:uncharacterized protein YcbK (DUF882 family)
MTLYSHYSQVEWDYSRWPNFSPKEIASKGDGSLLVNEEALDTLQRARNIVEKPFIIPSAYRDPLHNARVGGAPLSQHKLGTAFDILLENHNRMDLLKACQVVGFTGFGFYSTFLHVDTGRARYWGKVWN